MAYREALAILTSGEEAQVLSAAKLTAGKSAGRLSPLQVFDMPVIVASHGPEMMALWPQLLEQARIRAAGEQKAIQQQLKSLAGADDLHSLETPLALAGESVAERARYADISIMQSPHSDFAAAVFEGALFRSGRPIMLVPRTWTRDTLGDNVLVAWKPTREATRAVADAAPFLDSAKTITVVTVDAAAEQDGESPGSDIAAALARGGAHVAVRNLDSRGSPVEAAIVGEAKAIGADLIVMGGYGHGRLTEFVFGGVTRALSRECPIPILMSH